MVECNDDVGSADGEGDIGGGFSEAKKIVQGKEKVKVLKERMIVMT